MIDTNISKIERKLPAIPESRLDPESAQEFRLVPDQILKSARVWLRLVIAGPSGIIGLLVQNLAEEVS